jgi:hypothetical protein
MTNRFLSNARPATPQLQGELYTAQFTTDGEMNQLAEFLKHAHECLAMAAKTRNADDRAQLETLARHWKLLAAERESFLRAAQAKPDGANN